MIMSMAFEVRLKKANFSSIKTSAVERKLFAFKRKRACDEASALFYEKSREFSGTRSISQSTLEAFFQTDPKAQEA